MTDPRVIAAGLSEAQRYAILNAEEIVIGKLSVNADATTEYALALDGLLNDFDGDELTPLGLAVRQALIESPKP